MKISIELKPFGFFPCNMKFSERIRFLTRPYIQVSKKSISQFDKYKEDIFEDGSGQLFTYGDADGGVALMPLIEKAREVIVVLRG